VNALKRESIPTEHSSTGNHYWNTI